MTSGEAEEASNVPAEFSVTSLAVAEDRKEVVGPGHSLYTSSISEKLPGATESTNEKPSDEKADKPSDEKAETPSWADMFLQAASYLTTTPSGLGDPVTR